MAKGSSSYTDYNNLKKELQNKQFQPVYLFHGEEYYFLEAILKLLEEEAVDEATKSFNHHVFYGKDSNIQDILNTCRRFPMMADRQVVILKEAQHIRNTDGLEEYLANPSPTTILVWYHPGKKLAMNKKPGTLFKKHSVFYSAPIAEREIIPLVSSYIQHSGYDIEPKPLHLLAENSGFGFTTMVKELDKVFSNVEPGNKIRLEHIEKYVGINKDYQSV
jgi:DNA polymerase-3 subunit delta